MQEEPDALVGSQMPLFHVSVNVQESDSASRKRSLAGYQQGDVPDEPSPKPKKMAPLGATLPVNGQPLSTLSNRVPPSPSPSPSPSPVAPSSSTIHAANLASELSNNGTRLAHSQASASTPPASTLTIKRKRKTQKEKAAEEAARSEKKRNMLEEAAVRAADKAAVEAEKDAARKAKQAEKDARAAEKARIEAEKEEKRRKKEEEELSRKKAQPSLFAFGLKKDSATVLTSSQDHDKNCLQASRPRLGAAASPSTLPVSQGTSAYDELRISPFYVGTGVTWTRTAAELIDEETKETKLRLLDEYVRGERGLPSPFDPATMRRGRLGHGRGIKGPSVRETMQEAMREETGDDNRSLADDDTGDLASDRTGDVASDTNVGLATKIIARRLDGAADKLRMIPMKMLCFHEDVRPPYFGTATACTAGQLQQLARRPFGRVLDLAYDYDSEAEWEDPGEDLDESDGDDEELPSDEDIDSFLDDTDDVIAARPAFCRDISPVSSGMCFENPHREGPSGKLSELQLELLDGHLKMDHSHGINPFSTRYWDSPPKSVEKTHEPLPLPTQVSSTAMPPPPPAPPLAEARDEFALLTASAATSGFQTAYEPKDFVPRETLHDFKNAVIKDDISFLTKVTMIEVLHKRFGNCTKAQVRNTLEQIADRLPLPGGPKSDKKWVLKDVFAGRR